MSSKKKEREPFWLGGVATSMAVCFTHPLDQTKYRMQVLKSRKSMFYVMRHFAARDGIISLWSGLPASVLRQMTYSTARFGLYNFLATEALNRSEQSQLSFSTTIACAGLAGGMAGLIGNPAEIVLVRMCADGAKEPSHRLAYRNPFQGLFRVWKEEGLATFGKGLGPNIARSILMNVSQLATYSSVKHQLLSKTSLDDDIKTHIFASFSAGTVATTMCAPVDVIKSRLQSAVGKKLLFRIVSDGLRDEGPGFLMKGWAPAWLRLTPHTVLTFVFMERLRALAQAL